jgi:preprotein translocase subunit SecE
VDDTKPVTAGEKTGSTFNPIEFVRGTRREIAKVTWPTRRETMVTTAMIVLMAMIVGLFYFAIDTVLGYAIGHFLGMRG